MFPRHYAIAALIVFLTACAGTKKGPPAIGEAFVGPATLNIRQDLASKSKVVAVAKHGEQLEVIQARRRFVRVRTASGIMGWTDSRMLLSTAQMKDLRQLSELAANFPSQGGATVLEAVNMHTEPTRWSPSFTQIPENGAVQVLSHRATPKVAPPLNATPSIPVTVPPTPAQRRAKNKKAQAPVRPPMPKPPPLPVNWLELSQRANPEPGAEEEFAKVSAAEAAKVSKVKEEPEAEKPAPIEDWSLVRAKDGKAGWVLTRLLYMSIPDEVARYAEGHRITSFFAMADIKDGDDTKHDWLWTTIRRGGEAYEFDALRLFIWNVKRHRYETAYREKGLRGYFPVEAQKGTGERGEGATFSVVIENDAGQVLRKSYGFNGYRVSLTRTEPFDMTAEDYRAQIYKLQPPKLSPAPLPAPAAATGTDGGFLSGLKQKAKSLVGK
jgi:SH3-like domain-containing protein